MTISTLDLFKIGIGPSSSHTIGPMVAAKRFAENLERQKLLTSLDHLEIGLYGSLGATGRGHGTPRALLLGLMGETPEEVNLDHADQSVAACRDSNSINLLGIKTIPWTESQHLHFLKEVLPFHPNGMVFKAWGTDQCLLFEETFFSIGGGFVVKDHPTPSEDPLRPQTPVLPYGFKSGEELLSLCKKNGLSISELMMANENALRPEAETRQQLLKIWKAMEECIHRGTQHEGVLPGGLNVPRRAAGLAKSLALKTQDQILKDPMGAMDWISLFALAVNEENASGSKVVTAPTNGAAGIIPAVMMFYRKFVEGSSDEGLIKFLLTAGAIGSLYKENASISGAEVGCQGEVGSACSMAAGGLAEVLGGTPSQVENAAEIGMEHHLGLTCDPIGGLVQIPCIERNAMAAIKAIQAARLALYGDGQHYVSLDKVIETMRSTGADMKTKYKETARGGLALHVVSHANLSVNLPEC